MASDYSAATGADWEDAFAAPMSAKVPRGLGGLRLDQALVRMFPQYSRNRLQAWVRSGHIRMNGERCEPRTTVAGTKRSRSRLRPRRRAQRPRRSACRSRSCSRIAM
jgi:23S rRNA-/tRNA-specific pseudouridylate synthase